MQYTTAPVSIRLAVPDDAPMMAEVIMRSWEAAYKGIIPEDFIMQKNSTRLEQARASFSRENTTRYVIELDKNIVGIMTVAPPNDDDVDESFYELHNIYLLPEYYRQGIGTIAMEFAYQIARDLGKTEMTVWLLAENLSAKRFYEKCGFTTDGSLKITEYGIPLQSIRMRKTL